MAKYKIEIVDGCIGCGACVSTCPKLFDVEGTAQVQEEFVEDPTCAKEAAEVCPVGVIKITKIK